jgi:hypothetical protein
MAKLPQGDIILPEMLPDLVWAQVGCAVNKWNGPTTLGFLDNASVPVLRGPSKKMSLFPSTVAPAEIGIPPGPPSRGLVPLGAGVQLGGVSCTELPPS